MDINSLIAKYLSNNNEADADKIKNSVNNIIDALDYSNRREELHTSIFTFSANDDTEITEDEFLTYMTKATGKDSAAIKDDVSVLFSLFDQGSDDKSESDGVLTSDELSIFDEGSVEGFDIANKLYDINDQEISNDLSIISASKSAENTSKKVNSDSDDKTDKKTSGSYDFEDPEQAKQFVNSLIDGKNLKNASDVINWLEKENIVTGSDLDALKKSLNITGDSSAYTEEEQNAINALMDLGLTEEEAIEKLKNAGVIEEKSEDDSSQSSSKTGDKTSEASDASSSSSQSSSSSSTSSTSNSSSSSNTSKSTSSTASGTSSTEAESKDGSTSKTSIDETKTTSSSKQSGNTQGAQDAQSASQTKSTPEDTKLSEEEATILAEELFDSMDGLGTDEEQFYAVLNNPELDSGDIVAVIYKYEELHGSFIKQVQKDFSFGKEKEIMNTVADKLIGEAQQGNKAALKVLCKEFRGGTGDTHGTAEAFIERIFEKAGNKVLGDIVRNYADYNDGADIFKDIKGDFSFKKEDNYIEILNNAMLSGD